MGGVPYDDIGAAFESGGSAAGLDALIGALRNDSDRHALFRALLLKKRHELGLPPINPGDLPGVPPATRKTYELAVEQTCREIGGLYLQDGNIFQAWRYFRTIGDNAPVHDALEKLEPASASDETLSVALEHGVHPRRGFEIILQRDGICAAITLFDQDFSSRVADKQHAAALLVRALYKELVLGVRRNIHERFNEFPPETDLVELIRHRPWLFENGNSHADPQHIGAVARIGMLAESREDSIMALSIAEYGRMLGPLHAQPSRPPFDGFGDFAKYLRALLGQDAAETAGYFRFKLAQIDLERAGTFPAELLVLLFWRIGSKEDALEIWQQYLANQPPELPGAFTRPFYDLCIETRAFKRLMDVARKNGDSSAWAAARLLECGESPATFTNQQAALDQSSEELS